MAVTVKLDRSGRRGKEVTVISNIQHNPQVIEKLEKKLKKHCGAGGTSYAKTIEIQGNQIDKVTTFLEKEGFNVQG
ncbi:MAG: translation initiation factor [Balneolaceae bacterium]|nr:translation initiation factor [Balneolaceae bacterium]